MSIILTPAAPSLEPRAYLALEETFFCSEYVAPESDGCLFPAFNCERPIPQFIDLFDPLDPFKNDFFSFIDQVQNGQTIELEFQDLTTEIIYSITDNTYGTFKDVGDYPERPRVWSFIFNWNNVQGLIGFGQFKFTARVKSSIGTTLSEKTSPCFDLKPFDCDAAHGTVRIETTQTGYIHNGFDYRDIVFTQTTGIVSFQIFGWKQQIRWYGEMFPIEPEEESQYLQDSDRIEFQIQEKITEQFQLNLKFLRADFGQHILKDNFLADKILISDYNLSNYEFYRNKQLRKVSTDSYLRDKLNRQLTASFTFKDVDEGTIKRIYG